MKNFLILSISIFLLTSCFGKTNENFKNITSTGISSQIIKKELTNKVVFSDKPTDKIDGFYVSMKNSEFLTGAELGTDKVKQVEKRQFENLKIEIKGQLPYFIDKAQEYLKLSNLSGATNPIFLSTPDGVKFERLVLMLDQFNFKKDFAGVDHYKIYDQEKRFIQIKKTYLDLKSKQIK